MSRVSVRRQLDRRAFPFWIKYQVVILNRSAPFAVGRSVGPRRTRPTAGPPQFRGDRGYAVREGRFAQLVFLARELPVLLGVTEVNGALVVGEADPLERELAGIIRLI